MIKSFEQEWLQVFKRLGGANGASRVMEFQERGEFVGWLSVKRAQKGGVVFRLDRGRGRGRFELGPFAPKVCQVAACGWRSKPFQIFDERE
jgi:hypothetical protein